MKQATVMELQLGIRRILEFVKVGESFQVISHDRPLAVLSPVAKPAMARPDFVARLREIYRDKMLTPTGPEIVSELRGER